MSLIITMLKAPESVVMSRTSITFGVQGGSIGRGDENDLVLEDPERYLSSLHCQIKFENDQYYLIDQSTNGTFYNGSMDPMGKGTKLPIKDQDHFIIGDYEFSIQVNASPELAQDSDMTPLSPFADISDDPFASPADDSFGSFSSNPFPSAQAPARDSLFAEEPAGVDPLAALDKAQGSAGSPVSNIPEDSYDPFASESYSDGSDPMSEQLDWPEPVISESPLSGGIPDDWDDELFSEDVTPTPVPAPAVEAEVVVPRPAKKSAYAAPVEKPADLDASLSRQKVLEKANAKIQAELDALKKQAARSARQSSAGSAGVDTTFIHALGLDTDKLTDEEISRINQLGGEVLRQMIGGLMRVLGSRSAIKNEFRMNVTTIQPVENNPLKFSANVDDALENMFIKKGNAFKKPVQAVEEGFQGVAEHQLAVLAGIREAFSSILERFDPVLLEERFSQQNKGGILPGSQKARKWDAYTAYYQEVAGDIDRSFQYLFGDKFVRAYEDQLQKLAISRKAKNFTKND